MTFRCVTVRQPSFLTCLFLCQPNSQHPAMSIAKPTVVAMIPARYSATRFPAKLLQLLGEKTVIRHTYDSTVATGLFDDVIVVTDSDMIFEEIASNGGRVMMSAPEHESGTDRIAEIARKIEVDIVLNVQGDTPFVEKEPLRKLIEAFADDKVQVASMMQALTDETFIDNPNNVKVVVDRNHNSLLFTRSAIPYHANKQVQRTCFKHVGVYAFRKQALLDFTTWPMTPLEAIEKIECLRFLENGIQLKMVEIEQMGIDINVPEDLTRAAAFLEASRKENL
jgi:3-deoxy-manno-octulosonate cytidylyltransferase (CMP-KDO synthetase)